MIDAFSGLIVPSLIYFTINFGNSNAMNGWEIPSATDIAFTLVILAKLKLLVITIAIFDDIAVIVIIAIFYNKSLSLLSLSLGGFFIILMVILNRIFKINKVSIYVVIGFFALFCAIKSRVHAIL